MNVDVDLIEAAKNGCQESFCQMYEAVAPELYKLALYTLGNSHDAEDVVSETFLEAYKGISRLRDNHAFKPWIIKILNVRCKRRVAQYIRDKGNFDVESFIDLPAAEADLSVSHSDKVTVLSALGKLSPQERMIIVLSVLYGYTTKEIAQMLSSPQGTVSSKMYRAFKKLRGMLEDNVL